MVNISLLVQLINDIVSIIISIVWTKKDSTQSTVKVNQKISVKRNKNLRHKDMLYPFAFLPVSSIKEAY